MLASGRPVPQNNQPRKRGEGVALVFAGPAVHAWIDGGRQWKAWNSRIVSVTLSVGRNKERLHVISCYAPTFAASREMKDEFYACLQAVLLEIPQRDNFVLLGDFNARTGSRSAGSDWGSVRGPHGYGNLNDAGRELLTFLAINEATVCNTWFQKKEIHRQTWQHPKSKEMALHRLCHNPAVLSQKMLRCCCGTGGRMQHRSSTTKDQADRWAKANSQVKASLPYHQAIRCGQTASPPQSRGQPYITGTAQGPFPATHRRETLPTDTALGRS